MDLEFMLLDTLDGLRPRNKPQVASLAEATDAIEKIRDAEKGKTDESVALIIG